MDFSSEIKKIRRESLLSQTEFAQALGVSFATVNRWEKGKTHPTYKTIKAIQIFCQEQHIDCSECIKIWKELR